MRLLPLLFVLACSTPPAPEARGPHPVGSRTLMLTDASRERTLPVEVWYPADDDTVEKAEPITAMIPLEVDRVRYEAMLETAPEGCPAKTVLSARDAPPEDGPWPLVILSHCHGCTRFGYASIAEHLASRGIAVAAPDHLGNTLFDSQNGDGGSLDSETLAMRVADVRFVLDRLLDDSASDVHESLRGQFDDTRLGAMGHSFGSVTTGGFAQEEPRLKAIVGLAAPMESPLFPGIFMEDIAKPLLLVVAKEDNSISEFGNGYLRDNFVNAVPPAWKVELADTGHFNFTELAGLNETFMAGCGEANRQTSPDERFTYVPVRDSIEVVRTWVAAFFAAHLQDDDGAKAWLDAPPAQAGVESQSR